MATNIVKQTIYLDLGDQTDSFGTTFCANWSQKKIVVVKKHLSFFNNDF